MPSYHRPYYRLAGAGPTSVENGKETCCHCDVNGTVSTQRDTAGDDANTRTVHLFHRTYLQQKRKRNLFVHFAWTPLRFDQELRTSAHLRHRRAISHATLSGAAPGHKQCHVHHEATKNRFLLQNHSISG